MPNHQDRIDQLNQKLELLLSKQEGFAKELMSLYKEIEAVKKLRPEDLVPEKPVESPVINENPTPVEATEKIIPVRPDTPTKALDKELPRTKAPIPKKHKKEKRKWNLEKFIGENLISKIGIIITVIGIAIGVKYSIENGLISPLTRIVFGYLAGLGLLGFGIKLKAKYESYSAVLVSGALASLYFITFAAYSFYGLFPQLMAFALMLVFTAFGVVAALNYNNQVIAHIGLVGAYAIPFLLSNDSGSTFTLFSYMVIINLGILTISVKKYWKGLFYSAFGFTYLIYISWLSSSFNIDSDFLMAFSFLGIFFIIFYACFLAYKLIRHEVFLKIDVVLLLLNSFAFYGIGYGLLNQHETGAELLGLFTLANALVHFMVSVILFKKKLADRSLFNLVTGMVLVFITLAIPVQLDGNWVTLLWTLQAALLFYIGRTKSVIFYEHLSYPLMLLALFSLTHDWNIGYIFERGTETALHPILNIYFLTSVLFSIGFGFIYGINRRKPLAEPQPEVSRIMSFIVPIILLFVAYVSCYLEIEYYWDQLYRASEVNLTPNNEYGYGNYNYDLKNFGAMWLFNFTFLFFALLAVLNIKKVKNRILGIATLAFCMFIWMAYLTGGLYILSELRESYIDRASSEYYEIGAFNLGIRYVSYVFYALNLIAALKLAKRKFINLKMNIGIEIMVHLSLLWILSSELLNLMDLASSEKSYKLGLSLLWGTYALFLIGLGIYKKRKHLRICAISLFGITLAKLFFYDIASLNSISKTIVFVSLGVLLLIISFLYNKYKNQISDES
ncbi:Predicted membrane protein [Zobellia uliginosa]|uniref:Predicted membrane protein n=1 Tax=Zobellia uliginosa TaxID=143224 RepID=A0ABY1KZU7_9FLAO|nr:DUF2339 domain-containing protein [Zobellia uliginosa]SIS89760.1 Predicted membrane protein [Zobellia uliginosa]